MAICLNRRTFLAGRAVAAAFPMPAIAQNAPLKIGLMTVKTGPIAPAAFLKPRAARRSHGCDLRMIAAHECFIRA